MKLPDLIRTALGRQANDLQDVDIHGVVQDTRRVPAGGAFVFVARRGGSFDGHRFAEKAIEMGAVAVVGEAGEAELEPYPWRGRVPYIRVENDKVALARLAAAFYGHPSRAMVTLGVTGTDGKTTTSYLLHHLLSARYPTGLLSTAGIRSGETALAPVGHFTTPEAPEVQGFLARFRDDGCTHAVIESSSEGMAQHRLDEVAYDLFVWTNLSPEHLNYHKTMEAYREAKLSLVRRAEVGVLNADDASYPFFAAAARKVVSYGLEAEGADWRASGLEERPGLLRWQLRARIRGETVEAGAELPMVGSYNAYNALAALAAAHTAGLELPLLLERLASFPGVPGRMQVVQAEPFAVVVDFAHTAPALGKALQAVRPQTRGRLIVVVGAAGERDPGKRTPLGEAATRFADFAVFTEEDHRSEDLETILAQMAAGAEAAGGVEGRTFVRVPDRREAIRRAVALAREGDLVLLAGKGHEATLERTGETLPWNEVAEAERALREPDPQA